MKKNYYAPETRCLNIELQQMIANSNHLSNISISGGVVETIDEELEPGVQGESRRGYDIWEDEEDDW